MNVGSYTGAAALSAYEKWQEITSQNISAGTVPGYKKTDVSFSNILLDNPGGTPNTLRGQGADGSMPKISPVVGYAQGEIARTGNELDFAIQGPGFFQVQRGDGQVAYTRNGEFHLSPERQLVTKEGFKVLGDGGPVTFGNTGGPITINSEGSILQGDKAVGKLAVYESAKPQGLKRLSDGLFASADPNEQLRRVDNPAVLNGGVELSNVTPLKEMINLISISRAYEACQRIIMANDENTGRAIQSLGNS